MSFYIYIDSKYRNTYEYTNPSTFVITSDQTRDWLRHPKYTRNLDQECMSYVTIKDFWILYDNTNYQPFIKVNFHSNTCNDKQLISTIDPNKDINFILSYDKQLSNSILYKNGTIQFMRMKKDGEFTFNLYDIDNNILDIGLNGRLVFVVEIIPSQHCKLTEYSNIIT